jgi:hypothetical protein
MRAYKKGPICYTDASYRRRWSVLGGVLLTNPWAEPEEWRWESWSMRIHIEHVNRAFRKGKGGEINLFE